MSVRVNICQTFIGSESTISTVVYSRKYRKLVSGSEDGTLRLYNVDSAECIYKKKKNNGSSWESWGSSIHHIIIVRKGEEFITCQENGRVEGYIFKRVIDSRDYSPYCYNVFDDRRSRIKPVVRLQCLGDESGNNEHFMLCTCDCEIFIINSTRRKDNPILNKFEIPIGKPYKKYKLVKSKRYTNCIYINSSSKRNAIMLVNYNMGKIQRKYENHRDYNIYDMNVFENQSNGDEFLVCGGYGKLVFFYDTSTCNLIRVVEVEDWICCSLIICNKYLLVGSYGSVELFYLKPNEHSQKFECEKILGKKIHDGRIESISICQTDHGILLDFLSCSEDKSIKISGISGLLGTYYNEYEEKDFAERVKFLKDDEDKDEEGGKYFNGERSMIRISLWNNTSLYIFRFALLN